MCMMSLVIDHFSPYIPNPNMVPQTTMPNPNTIVGVPISVPSINIIPEPIVDPKELRELIDAFKQAAEAAKVFDRLTGQPDCEDPEKAKLVERVEALEERLDALAKALHTE